MYVHDGTLGHYDDQLGANIFKKIGKALSIKNVVKVLKPVAKLTTAFGVPLAPLIAVSDAVAQRKAAEKAAAQQAAYEQSVAAQAAQAAARAAAGQALDPAPSYSYPTPAAIPSQPSAVNPSAGITLDTKTALIGIGAVGILAILLASRR